MTVRNDPPASPSPVGPAVAVLLLALIVCLSAAIGSRDPGLAPIRTLDVNAASASELTMLPRIGPVLASRIVEAREENGPFRSAADLDEVRGIGPRTLAQVDPHLAFGEGGDIEGEDRP